MYCKFCGKKIDSDSIYCCYCGEKIFTKVLNYKENKISQSNHERIIKDGIIYEDGYPVGKVPSYCNPHADKFTEW